MVKIMMQPSLFKLMFLYFCVKVLRVVKDILPYLWILLPIPFLRWMKLTGILFVNKILFECMAQQDWNHINLCVENEGSSIWYKQDIWKMYVWLFSHKCAITHILGYYI